MQTNPDTIGYGSQIHTNKHWYGRVLGPNASRPIVLNLGLIQILIEMARILFLTFADSWTQCPPTHFPQSGAPPNPYWNSIHSLSMTFANSWAQSLAGQFPQSEAPPNPYWITTHSLYDICWVLCPKPTDPFASRFQFSLIWEPFEIDSLASRYIEWAPLQTCLTHGRWLQGRQSHTLQLDEPLIYDSGLLWPRKELGRRGHHMISRMRPVGVGPDRLFRILCPRLQRPPTATMKSNVFCGVAVTKTSYEIAKPLIPKQKEKY